MLSRRVLPIGAAICLLLVIVVLLASGGGAPAPSSSPEPSPSVSPSPSEEPTGGLPSADPFRTMVIDDAARLSAPLALCTDGTMTVDLQLAATAPGPVDLFLVRGAAIDAATPAGVRAAVEAANGTIVRAEPGSAEIVVFLAPPGEGTLRLVALLSRLERSPLDAEEWLEVPAAFSISEVGDAGC